MFKTRQIKVLSEEVIIYIKLIRFKCLQRRVFMNYKFHCIMNPFPFLFANTFVSFLSPSFNHINHILSLKPILTHWKQFTVNSICKGFWNTPWPWLKISRCSIYRCKLLFNFCSSLKKHIDMRVFKSISWKLIFFRLVFYLNGLYRC